jgi:pyruvate/2-oxoglutarate dehydrogenase complex dihydrolipoamide acyltransferase (E2) component
MLFQELMDNYSAIEDRISETQDNVANLDTDKIRRQGEVEATDAARRQARELGVDLTKIEGTGADGRIIVSDVIEAAEAMEDGALGEESEISEDGAAGEAAQGVQDAAGQAAGQAQQAVGQATDQAGQVAGQAQDAAGGATQQATGGARAEEPKVTNAARRKAEELGVDLSTIEGTGSGGLITIKDVTGS